MKWVDSMKKLTRMALVAALYVAFTILPPFYAFAYGPIQIRVSEAFTVLPFLFPETIAGVTIGCFLANIYGQNGPWDIIFGTLITLLAAVITSKMKKAYLAPLPPVLLNAFGVSMYLAKLFKVPYFYSVFYIMIGELIACYGIGYPLLKILLKHRMVRR
ncbi:MAG: QueT transporter family protein [Candidatus Atribacteria bacterium]|nr:QueT transporter family protein [Candidatus Atribacteria bacterium]